MSLDFNPLPPSFLVSPRVYACQRYEEAHLGPIIVPREAALREEGVEVHKIIRLLASRKALCTCLMLVAGSENCFSVIIVPAKLPCKCLTLRARPYDLTEPKMFH